MGIKIFPLKHKKERLCNAQIQPNINSIPNNPDLMTTSKNYLNMEFAHIQNHGWNKRMTKKEN